MDNTKDNSPEGLPHAGLSQPLQVEPLPVAPAFAPAARDLGGILPAKSAPGYMPILGTVFALRMDVLNEAQAQKNHGQTLARLAERGGLGMSEAVAIVEQRRWRAQSNTDAAKAIAAIAIPRGES